MEHQCPACGYDVSPQSRDRESGAEIVCSECGTPTTIHLARRAALGYKQPVRVPGWIFVTVFLVVIVGAWQLIRLLIRVF